MDRTEYVTVLCTGSISSWTRSDDSCAIGNGNTVSGPSHIYILQHLFSSLPVRMLLCSGRYQIFTGEKTTVESVSWDYFKWCDPINSCCYTCNTPGMVAALPCLFLRAAALSPMRMRGVYGHSTVLLLKTL